MVRTSPVLLVPLASILLRSGFAQPIDTGLTCPPQFKVPPTDAERAEAVVRRRSPP